MTKMLSLSKAQGSSYAADHRMPRFLRVLERWVEHVSRRGYRVIPDPDPGPGTMRWRAVRLDE
jgi:hypothetical protein